MGMQEFGAGLKKMIQGGVQAFHNATLSSPYVNNAADRYNAAIEGHVYHDYTHTEENAFDPKSEEGQTIIREAADKLVNAAKNYDLGHKGITETATVILEKRHDIAFDDVLVNSSHDHDYRLDLIEPEPESEDATFG